ncbi:MAG TPA: hypothetical protein VN631_17765, partial [Negativicutes bacterium]|nr:hypothetical protein [Negativicutes bacterium]
ETAVRSFWGKLDVQIAYNRAYLFILRIFACIPAMKKELKTWKSPKSWILFFEKSNFLHNVQKKSTEFGRFQRWHESCITC